MTLRQLNIDGATKYVPKNYSRDGLHLLSFASGSLGRRLLSFLEAPSFSLADLKKTSLHVNKLSQSIVSSVNAQ